MKRVIALAAVVALGLMAGVAAAQDSYPSRPITLVAPFPPGGVDVLFDRTPTYQLDQFVGIARLTNDLPLLVVNAQNPWKSAPELVAELKEKPGELTFASSGPYGASHVPMEWFLQAPAALKTLRDAVRQAVQDPEFKNTIDKAETEIAYLDSDDFKKFWDRDAAAVSAVIKRIGKVETK
jgi:tripartite-type tricarboxylate transporter receptor subunit TctC